MRGLEEGVDERDEGDLGEGGGCILRGGMGRMGVGLGAVVG